MLVRSCEEPIPFKDAASVENQTMFYKVLIMVNFEGGKSLVQVGLWLTMSNIVTMEISTIGILYHLKSFSFAFSKPHSFFFHFPESCVVN